MAIQIALRGKHGVGKIALIDECDAHLARLKWHTTAGYARRADANQKTLFLHWAVIGKPPKGMVTDHINRDRLDCRRSNLRFVTARENLLNSDRCDRVKLCGYKARQRNHPAILGYRRKWGARLRVVDPKFAVKGTLREKRRAYILGLTNVHPLTQCFDSR